MERRGYPLTVLHEYRMTPGRVIKTLKYIEENDLNEVRSRCGISESRMSLVPYAVRVLREVVSRFKPKDITISSYGIREGMLYEQMPAFLDLDAHCMISLCLYLAEPLSNANGSSERHACSMT